MVVGENQNLNQPFVNNDQRGGKIGFLRKVIPSKYLPSQPSGETVYHTATDMQ